MVLMRRQRINQVRGIIHTKESWDGKHLRGVLGLQLAVRFERINEYIDLLKAAGEVDEYDGQIWSLVFKAEKKRIQDLADKKSNEEQVLHDLLDVKPAPISPAPELEVSV